MRTSAIRMATRGVAVLVALLVAALLAPTAAHAEQKAWDAYEVVVERNYLALRTRPSYDDANEIGELYTGDVVYVKDKASNGQYWKVYSPKHGKDGWVNRDFLRKTRPAGYYRVHVEKGYLALRSYPAYDEANEKGELHTGDVVEFVRSYDDTYWWVRSPKLGKSGYVNKNYLVAL